jgi:hypothetical protein
MSANRGGEAQERIELVQLARACDRQSGDGDLAVVTASSEHDLPPLNGSPERAREVPHIIVCGVDGAARRCEGSLLNRQHNHRKANRHRDERRWIGRADQEQCPQRPRANVRAESASHDSKNSPAEMDPTIARGTANTARGQNLHGRGLRGAATSR